MRHCVRLSTCIISLCSAFLLTGCSLRERAHVTSQNRALLHAAMTGDLRLLKKLDAKGANLNFQEPSARNWSPLIAAVYHEETNIIEYLLTRNVNLNLHDRDG